MLVFVDMKPDPCHLQNMLDYLKELIPQTRAFDGCLRCEIYLEKKDLEPSHLLFVDRWENLEKLENYEKWRSETGVLKKLRSFLLEDPIIRMAEDTGI